MDPIQPVIETANLTKSFGDIRAVDGLSLSIHAGEMFGLVGPDGAGKTTTLRMLCGVLLPTEGSARVLGYDIRNEPDRVKERIGYLSQRFSLYGDLTVDENIEFFAEINGVYDFRQRREELLDFTRLIPFRDRLAERLSGGMKQKLALACTLIHTPKIILLDEPTTGVDPVSRRDFWKILQALLADGITIIMSTPYLDEAERCTRVALMNGGKAMVVSTPAEIKEKLPGQVIEIVCNPVRTAFQVLKGRPETMEVQAFGDRLNIVVRDAKRDTPAIERILRAAGVSMTAVRGISPTLENVFISLLTHREEKEVQA
jgi:ABC-2 type transport system ATP-binding protein